VYTEAGEVFSQFCQNNGVSFKNKRILEIGCGTGFYTELISALGENLDFVVLDVTDIKFPELQAKFPYLKFIRADITHPISDMKPFDIIVMIDVVQHIVTDKGFRAAMLNISKLLAPHGVFIVAPISSRRSKDLFYVRSWLLEDFHYAFSGYHFSKLQEFRGHSIGLISR
jgi:2-polyprenyl-3-methyl-5-hydroxy-6-metoxy-1,4-benzoquinol methylase